MLTYSFAAFIVFSLLNGPINSSRISEFSYQEFHKNVTIQRGEIGEENMVRQNFCIAQSEKI